MILPPRRAFLAASMGALLSGCLGRRAASGEPPAAPPRRPSPVQLARIQGDGPITVSGSASRRALFELRSGNPHFGGLSGLLIEGDRMIFASDRGWLWSARAAFDETGGIHALDDWRVQRVLLPDAGRFVELDIEAIARGTDATFLLSLERHKALLVLDRAGLKSRRLQPWPPSLRDLPRNEGVEAVTDLSGDRWLLIGEASEGNGTHRAAVIGADQAERPLLYVGEMGFHPTDVTRLGGTLYVLERRLSLLGGLSAVIRMVEVDLADPFADGLIAGEIVARIEAVGFGANFEGIAAVPAPDGVTVLYLVSDDNFLFLLSTLLLELRLPAPPGR